MQQLLLTLSCVELISLLCLTHIDLGQIKTCVQVLTTYIFHK